MSYMSTLDQTGISVKKMSAYLTTHPGIDFDEAVATLERKPRYTVIGETKTCGHRHTSLGRAKDCYDRLTDATCFCRHGKLTIPAYHTCLQGCTAPMDNGSEWKRPTIRTI